jgi:hypothetical protein
MNNAICKIGAELKSIEDRVLNCTLNALKKNNPGRVEVACGNIFSIYTSFCLWPFISQGCASRAAAFSRERLIPDVLSLERQMATEFHKGGLFYDTGLAHLLAGNEDGYERFLAMANEEDCKTRKQPHNRGASNLRCDGLPQQTINKRMEFACKLLNGEIARGAVHFAFMTGEAPVGAKTFHEWRKNLPPLDHFELLRIIHDVEVHLGEIYPNYLAVDDHPFIMLRLAKALSHLAQWVESCLTHWQGGLVVHKTRGGKVEPVKTLRQKLACDLQFVDLHNKAAGGCQNFPGNMPEGVKDINRELSDLLRELETKPPGTERHWRLLRILYIVRNSTAHTIQEGLDVYKDRELLLNLLQVVFVSVWVIWQLKGKPTS